MGYAIVGGIGLLIGLALLVWGLRERSSRHTAERRADASLAQEKMLRAALRVNSETMRMEQKQRKQAQIAADGNRMIIEQLRSRLRLCTDPSTVRKWLDNELKETVL